MKLLINLSEEELDKLKAIVANNSIGTESIRNIIEKVTDGIEIKEKLCRYVYVLQIIDDYDCHFSPVLGDTLKETFASKKDAEQFANENYYNRYNADLPGIRILEKIQDVEF